ncbi:hypothetical protein DPM19_08685 [Actinomadura craniellae]|uniref:DUF3558 domain-containing protein n=1 Tax=Actinomadura craniellae TaxID=2231787 RepID=A0A365H9Z2_9ACTN|nr:hypothetical protein DPM19_08685 [Actinomadura craniellae]
MPGAMLQRSANNTLTTCTYSASGPEFRWLRVEVRLHAPADSETPTRDARDFFAAQFAQARQGADPIARTVSLRAEPGLGDEAYRWFKVDKGQPTAVGVVATRLRNAIITVSYSEEAAGKGTPDAREERCLTEATRVTREVLAGFP